MTATAFLFGMAIGGLITVAIVKGLLFYAQSELAKANKMYSEVVREGRRAIKRNEEAITIRDRAARDKELAVQMIEKFKEEYGVKVNL